MSRVFIIGAGFSKALANAPLADEFMRPIYQIIKEEEYSGILYYEEGKKLFLRLVEVLSESVGEELRKGGTKVKNESGIELISSINFEYLMTWLDINIERPFIPRGIGVDLSNHRIPYIRDFNSFQLKDIRQLIEHFIVKLLLPDALSPNLELLSGFAGFIRPGDMIITFNYDLLIEQALWKAELWSPQDGYLLGKLDDVHQEFDKSLLFNTKVPVIKLHGSVNWQKPNYFNDNIQIDLCHPNSFKEYFDGLEIGFRNIHRPCELYYGQFIIAPTFMKKYRSKYEVHLVKSACDAISKCDEIYAIGYSFPEADTLTSFLLAQIPSTAKIKIINRSADDIARMLSENFRFIRNQIINEQSNIEDWISSGFKYLSHDHYLDERQSMEDMKSFSPYLLSAE